MLRLALLAAVVSVCACDKTEYESATVTVDTVEGPVTCQLYRRDMVLWDRALTRPATMTDSAANEACRTEGYREKSGAPVATGVEGEVPAEPAL
ncbi:hypothetical protein RGQ15_01200 [Paracoccus sp. MBLB3053]|uniref:Lipoprotein n=1 Tax=Paracoccus aurantius TaxID=3073814 RepID=A0ABU2HMC9_9RHOB|nr:hypothetical protein [Paracoccus sp. MBLB3053]MDS9466196.1 hypothetical protein [Paracoccus sp. MBLB3053]